MSGTDDEQRRGRRQHRRGEHDLGVLTPPSIPRIDLPAVPAPRGRRRAVEDPAPMPPLPLPLPTELTTPSALVLRNRASRTSRRTALLAAFCLVAMTSAHLPATGRWPLLAVLLLGAARTALVWARAFRRRRAERAHGYVTWPGAEELARL